MAESHITRIVNQMEIIVLFYFVLVYFVCLIKHVLGMFCKTSSNKQFPKVGCKKYSMLRVTYKYNLYALFNISFQECILCGLLIYICFTYHDQRVVYINHNYHIRYKCSLVGRVFISNFFNG